MKKMEWFKDDKEREEMKDLLHGVPINKDDESDIEPIEESFKVMNAERTGDDLLEEEIELKQNIAIYQQFVKEYEMYDKDDIDEDAKQVVREYFLTQIVEPFQKLFKHMKLERENLNKEMDLFTEKFTAKKTARDETNRMTKHVENGFEHLKKREIYWKKSFVDVLREAKKYFSDKDQLLNNLLNSLN